MTIHDEEGRSLAELYAAAQAEGGTLTVYAGGDFAAQQDGTAKAFRAAFPKIDFQVVVDYSKYHNVRIDRQLRGRAGRMRSAWPPKPQKAWPGRRSPGWGAGGLFAPSGNRAVRGGPRAESVRAPPARSKQKPAQLRQQFGEYPRFPP